MFGGVIGSPVGLDAPAESSVSTSASVLPLDVWLVSLVRLVWAGAGVSRPVGSPLEYSALA